MTIKIRQSDFIKEEFEKWVKKEHPTLNVSRHLNGYLYAPTQFAWESYLFLRFKDIPPIQLRYDQETGTAYLWAGDCVAATKKQCQIEHWGIVYDLSASISLTGHAHLRMQTDEGDPIGEFSTKEYCWQEVPQ